MPIPAPAGNAAVPHRHEQEHAPEPPEAIIEPIPESIIDEVAAGVATAATEDAAEVITEVIAEVIADEAGGAAAAEDEAIAIPAPAVPFCCIAICIN